MDPGVPDEVPGTGQEGTLPFHPPAGDPSRPGGLLASRFRILRLLGRGGMGEVYLAQDVRLNRQVAIKMLPAELSRDPERLARFEREARTAAQLNHPNLATVYDQGQTEERPFIAMEHVEGTTVRDLLHREGPMPAMCAVDTAIQIADGLAAAHARGIIHRDLKPANVMVTVEGRVKILDFGLAKAYQTEPAAAADPGGVDDLTGPGRLVGTVNYMSPEQARGQAMDARSDLFSLGVVLYEMSTGRAPFQRATHADTVSAILNASPPPAADVNPAVPPGLARVIHRLLAKAPGDRYPSSADVLVDLRRVKQDLESGSGAAPSVDVKRPGSIAVLPFVNMSPDPENEYFSDGLAEELLNALVGIEGLRVASRTSAFQFKGKTADVRAIGRSLGVETVLEGSVRKAGSRVRITAQLINVADGYHMWSERYDRDLEDIFAVQDEIARTITDRLRVEVAGGEEPVCIKRTTENFEAYNLYLKGRHFWNRRHRGWLDRSTECFQHAIEIDPSYALAHTGLADAYSTLGIYGFLPPEESFPKAKAAAVRALEIDDALAEAHFSLGYAEHWFLHDVLDAMDAFRDAMQAFRRALDLNPKMGLAHLFCGQALFLLGREEEGIAVAMQAQDLDPLSPLVHAVVGLLRRYQGRFDDALGECRRGADIEPDHPVVLWARGTIYMGMGRYADAEEAFRKAAEVEGRNSFYLGMLGAALGAAGRRPEARGILEELEARSRDEYVNPLFLAWVHIGMGETERAARMYTQVPERAIGTFWPPTDPLFDPIRSDPRFRAFYRARGYARTL